MSLDPAALLRSGERIGEARNFTKADVYLVRDGDRALVVKTVAHRSPVSRRLLGGFLLRREGRVLAMLRGVAGVPNLVATTPTSLVVDWLPGDTLFQRRKTGMSPETATRLVALLADLHARGFAHGDIGRRDVLVAPDGSVSLVDFATAVGPGAPPLLWRVLAPWWRRRDAARLAKLIRRYRRRWDARVARGAGTKA